MEFNVSSHLPYTTELEEGNETATNVSYNNVTVIPSNAEALTVTRFVVQRVLVPLITSVGFFGNIISIRVLTHRSMVSSTNCYLTALAIFDLLYLVFSFSLSLKHYNVVGAQDSYRYWFYFGKTLTDICSNVSVCLTVTFSLERLVAVCYPMKGRAICTPQRARIITIGVVVLAVACTTPEFFEKRLVEVIENNQSRYDFEYTAMYQSNAYQLGYYNFLVFTFTVLPLVLLSTFNGLLVKAVISATRIRKQMAYTSMKQDRSRREKEQNRITVMLIGVVVVFLICQFPNAALLLYNIYLSSTSTKLTEYGRNNLRIAGNFVNILVLINSSTNFILYSVMSTKFRRVCLIVLCECGKRNKDAVTKTETSLYNGHLPLHFRSRRCSNHEQRNGWAYCNGQFKRSNRFTEDSRNGQLAIKFDRRDRHLGLNCPIGNQLTPICTRRLCQCRQNSLQVGQQCVRSTNAQKNAKIRDSNDESSTDKSGASELFEFKIHLRNDSPAVNTVRLLDTDSPAVNTARLLDTDSPAVNTARLFDTDSPAVNTARLLDTVL